MAWSLTSETAYELPNKYDEFDDAKKAATEWSKMRNGESIFIWKETNGEPIKWMEVKDDGKDCQDQYFECVSECDINDNECEESCVTDLKECDIPEIEIEKNEAIEQNCYEGYEY